MRSASREMLADLERASRKPDPQSRLGGVQRAASRPCNRARAGRRPSSGEMTAHAIDEARRLAAEDDQQMAAVERGSSRSSALSQTRPRPSRCSRATSPEPSLPSATSPNSGPRHRPPSPMHAPATARPAPARPTSIANAPPFSPPSRATAAAPPRCATTWPHWPRRPRATRPNAKRWPIANAMRSATARSPASASQPSAPTWCRGTIARAARG